MNSNDLDDDLSDLLGRPMRPVSEQKQPPASYVQKDFLEPCPKCNGRGRFISYAGRDCGPCFTCKGAGKRSFKTSPESRATARASNAAKAQEKASSLAGEIVQWQEAHAAAWQWMTSNNARGNEFAKSLCEALYKYGSLTEKQLAAVERNLAKMAERKAEREAAAPAVDATKIEKAFAIAREKAARPGQLGTFTKPLSLTSPDNITLSFQPGSIGSQWEGMLFAKCDNKKLGSIKDGKFMRRFECTDAEEAAVIACASDPETAVVAYAKAFSRCGVCGQRLLNDVSIARGIGPICAEKFGW
jgi:hypothetical protein